MICMKALKMARTTPILRSRLKRQRMDSTSVPTAPIGPSVTSGKPQAIRKKLTSMTCSTTTMSEATEGETYPGNHIRPLSARRRQKDVTFTSKSTSRSVYICKGIRRRYATTVKRNSITSSPSRPRTLSRSTCCRTEKCSKQNTIG